MMRKLLTLVCALLITAACSAPPAAKPVEGEKPYFDAAKADALVPGKSTREDARRLLGEPYADDPRKSDDLWTYMYTLKRQLVLTFKGGVLAGKEWSEEYGIGGKQ